MPNVVSDTGPILALANVDQFDLLRQLYSKVFIPPAVRAEVKDEVSLAAITSANWITIQTIKDELAVNLLREELDPGESEAIILAKELSADLILIDDRAARRKAQSIGLNVIGTLGVLLLEQIPFAFTTHLITDETDSTDFSVQSAQSVIKKTVSQSGICSRQTKQAHRHYTTFVRASPRARLSHEQRFIRADIKGRGRGKKLICRPTKLHEEIQFVSLSCP